MGAADSGHQSGLKNTRKSRVQVTREGWWIDGKLRVLLCASLFYFRVPRELWADRIERAAQAGYHALDVYIPWNYHEPERGMWLFEGDRDVRAFLALAKEAGMYVIARPGPYICSEWDGGALPAWLYPALSHPEVDPRSQTTFYSGHRVLRQADERFLAELSRWYDAVLPILREEQLDAGGPVLAVQIDNELDFYPCADPKGYLSFLKERALAYGITVPLLACSGEDGVSAATGDLEDVVPTANIYSRYRAPGLEERARRVREQLERRNAPLTVTETDRNHFTLRRLLSAGARFLGPYLQVSGHHTAYFAGQNNWGKPSTFLQTDYDFGGMVGPDGELRDEFYEGRILAGFIEAFEPELVTTEPHLSPVTAQNAGGAETFPAATLASPSGARFLFVPNLGDEPLHVTDPVAMTVQPHRVGVVSCGIDLASRGVPVKLVRANAEISRLSPVDRGAIAVVAYDPGDDAAPVELIVETPHDAVVSPVRGSVEAEAVPEGDWQAVENRGAPSGTPAGSPPELAANSPPPPEPVAGSPSAPERTAGSSPAPAPGTPRRWRITLSPAGRPHDDLAATLIQTGGARLVLLFAPRWLAGRAWRVDETALGSSGSDGTSSDALHLGWDWVSASGNEVRRSHSRRVYRVGTDGGVTELPAGWLERHTQPLSLPAQAAGEYRPVQKPSPIALLRRVPSDERWHGSARYLETLGVNYGAAYYRFHVSIDGLKDRRPGLWIGGASDAVSFYINGNYLGTALPRGRSVWLTGRLPWQEGENEVIVRTEIMGHSNFHDTTVPVTHLGSMRGLAAPVILTETSPGEEEYERHAAHDDLPSRDRSFIYGAPQPAGATVETEWELWRAPILEEATSSAAAGEPQAFPLELEGGAWTEVTVKLPAGDPGIPLWARFCGKGIKGEVWIGRRLVGRFWLDDHPDLLFTGGRWPERIWLPEPWLAGGAVTLRLLATGKDGGILERIEWLRSTGGR